MSADRQTSTAPSTPPDTSPVRAGRSGTGTGGAADTATQGAPGSPQPTTQRPADQEGPTGSDGAQHPPSDRDADPAEWERRAQGDVEPPPAERDTGE